MKLQSFAACTVFVVLLFGIATSAHAQQGHTLLSSLEEIPARLFGSTSSCGCAQACDSKCSVGCGQEDGCGRGLFHRPKSAPAFAPAQKSCGYGVVQKCAAQKTVAQKCAPAPAPLRKSCDCGVTQKRAAQKSVAQKCVAPKMMAQKSVAQKCVAPKTIMQKTVAQKGNLECCDDGCSWCRPKRVGLTLSGLDCAVKGLFRGKSDCCAPCADQCCDTNITCSQRGGEADSADCYDSPKHFRVPSPYDDLDEPQSEGNPFEDDAVPPPPPISSEASIPLRPQPLLGPVAAREATSPFRIQTPARISPAKATQLRTKPQLAEWILDRGNSTSSRRYPAARSNYKLTSAQSEVR